MSLFKSKKKEDSLDTHLDMPTQFDMPQQQPQAPVEQVTMMKHQGYTNNQIIQTLQSQGYSTTQISDAIGQSGLSGAQQPQMEAGMSDYGHFDDAPSEAFEQPQPAPMQRREVPMQTEEPATIDEERIQEIAESIIDEKWDELAVDIRKVVEWKERSEERITKIEQQLLDMKISIDSLTKSIMGKISSYDQNIIDVGTEIKAMEKVFQKVLPTMTESVNRLERATKNISSQKK
ncbi:MAG: hypothetical protein AABX00_07050 [Nanoarchaeota archaeon]